MRIFVCYASEDEAVAEEVASGLRNDGHEVFHGPSSLQPARQFHGSLRQAVARSDLFVFLISPHSVARGRYTLSELKLARKKWPRADGRVLPVVVAEVAPEEIPAYLRSVSLLEPEGDVAAEVAAAVAEVALPDVPRRVLRWLPWAAGALALVAAAVLAAVFIPEPDDGPRRVAIEAIDAQAVAGGTEVEIRYRAEEIAADEEIYVRVGDRGSLARLVRRLDARSSGRSLISLAASAGPPAGEVCAALEVRSAAGEAVERSETICTPVEGVT